MKVRATQIFVALLVPSATMVGIACSAPDVGDGAHTKDELIVKRDRTPPPKKPTRDTLEETPTKRGSTPIKATPADDGPRTTCSNDTQCGGSGRICEGTFCVAGCRDSSTCNGGSCINRQCVAQTDGACAEDVDCPLGAICTLRQCVAGCHTTSDCPIDEACSNGTCFFSPEPAPTTSSTGTTPPPTSSGKAGSGSESSTTACVADFECDIGKICVAGACTPGCKSTGDCLIGQTCSFGMCI